MFNDHNKRLHCIHNFLKGFTILQTAKMLVLSQLILKTSSFPFGGSFRTLDIIFGYVRLQVRLLMLNVPQKNC